ncbi:MAG: hypothetical protein ACR5K7_05795 [Symbiopectobacterium sp.]
MSNSLNPVDIASKIAAMSQLHFGVDTDRIVPSVIVHFLLLSGVFTAIWRCADMR